jgi:DNA-binding GntR family transcriptional regulator
VSGGEAGGPPGGGTAVAERDPRKYVQIAAAVRTAIAGGELAAGDLVLIAGLAADHRAARQTAAKALALLEREGLVRRYPGHGYAVQPARAG